MASGCLAKVVFSDAKHNFIIHYLAAIGLLLVSPVVFGFSGLDERLAAIPLEMLAPILGIILMTPVFMPEQNESIYDVVRSKKISHTLVCLLRILLSAVIIALLVGGLSLHMYHSGSQVTARVFASALISALTLGALGTFASALGDSSIIGYMVSASYFVLNMLLHNKLKKFDLFTFTDGGTKVNLWLAAAAAILVFAALLWRKIRK
ncbi:hypothetical protein [Ruminococcus sp.]|uniref:hypothetical protein n=1 Tax=Ruminococcus sp. TaxID=41978 RepID=UPI002600E362|nr:hypothetical protein [Ruminococcus sp.]MBQ8967549.1 hypothetical protein [Ruminococcus sp.]